jgi:hypothetical protein
MAACTSALYSCSNSMTGVVSSLGVRGLSNWPTSSSSEPGMGLDFSYTAIFPSFTLAVVNDGHGRSVTSLETSIDFGAYVGLMSAALGDASGDWWIVCEPLAGFWHESDTGKSGVVAGFRTGLGFPVSQDASRYVIVEYGWHHYSAEEQGSGRESRCFRSSFLWSW